MAYEASATLLPTCSMSATKVLAVQTTTLAETEANLFILYIF